MTNAIKALAQWKESIPQDGLLDFVLKVILALIVYFIGTKLIGWLCKNLRKHLVKFGSDVAISLALQGGLSNFAGGLIIMFLRPFSVGDYIIENGEKTEGTVQKIELYYTTLMTIDSRRIVIPNSVLTNDSITNVTAMEKRRLEIKVGISYESDLLLAKQILRELIEKDPELLDREETQVFVDELGDSAVILGLRAWVKTEEFWNTKWRMNEQIKLEFDKRGIRIPYPQMDVHMHR